MVKGWRPLPWAMILPNSAIIQETDFTTRKSVFWEDGWDEAPEDCVGRTVGQLNKENLDGEERIWVRPTGSCICNMRGVCVGCRLANAQYELRKLRERLETEAILNEILEDNS